MCLVPTPQADGLHQVSGFKAVREVTGGIQDMAESGFQPELDSRASIYPKGAALG